MEYSALTAISPIDGRYQNKTDPLRPVFSEYGLFRFRVFVEIEWLKMLTNDKKITEIRPLSKQSTNILDQLASQFSLADAREIKKIEAITKHDVKAVEYFIRDKISAHKSLEGVGQFVHFGCTSEDINNLSHALMLKEARDNIILPRFDALLNQLNMLTRQYAAIPMIARTHGQTASPTTLGKEIGVYLHRLSRQRTQWIQVALLGKCNGAVGNFNAHLSAYPTMDWMGLSKKFVAGLGLTWNPHTTQIESHDYMAEYFHALIRINTILLDFSRDIWSYISCGYFKLKLKKDEIGSSTMPHKVNPIDFENAEGNLGLANSIFSHLAKKLPISRWQRDLTDSTVLRNMGVAMGYTLIAFEACIKGLDKLEADEARLSQDLQNAWEILAEPIQTVMRRYGVEDAYEQLKELTRGQIVTKTDIYHFIELLRIPKEAKKALLTLTPASYTGNAAEQAKYISTSYCF